MDKIKCVYRVINNNNNNNNCNSHFPRSVNRVRGGGEGRRAGFVWTNFVLMFYVRVVSGNRTGMGSQVGTELDGQTLDFFPPRERWVELVPTPLREIENYPQLE